MNRLLGFLRTRFFKMDQWWLSLGAPHTLALLRICFGGLSFISLSLLYGQFDIWYSELGMVPSAAADNWGGLGGSIGLLRGVSSLPVTRAFFIATLLASFCMTLGLFSRTATWLTWIGLFSLQNRNPFILCGADMTIRVILFYLLWAQSGEVYSVDRFFRRNSPISKIPLWPQRLICVQVSVLYLSSIWYKCLGVAWQEGNALYFVWQYPDYQRQALPPFLMQPPITTVLTYTAFFIEASLGILPYFKRFRGMVLLMGLALHLSIDYTLVIPLFSYATIATYLSFYSGEEIKEFLGRFFGRFKKVFSG